MPENDEISYLLRMPDVVFEHILSYLTYDGMAKSRIVCRHFNNVSQRLLNRGFYAAVQLHAKCSKEVKSQLPRRESQRSNHPLAKHNNILHALETRLSLLKMTFCKYIHYNACCFIPGKVVDELFKILRLINNSNQNLVPHEVLTELRDISSMAMDYFEEKISPTLRNPNLSSPPPQSSPSASSSLSVLSSPFNSKLPSLSSSSRSPCTAFDALNASMQATLSSLSHCFEDSTPGASSMISGSSSSTFFPYSNDLLDGEMKSAIDNLLPPSPVLRSGLFGPTQLVPVPAETLKALVTALRETRGRKTRAERHLSVMQTKLLEVCRKVQDQERTISEQSRLLAEHSVRFSQHSRSIFEIVNNSVTAEVVDMENGNISLLSIPEDESDMTGYSDTALDDDANFGYQGDGGAVVSVQKGTLLDDSLNDPQGSGRHQSSREMAGEKGVSSVGTKTPSKEWDRIIFEILHGKPDVNLVKSYQCGKKKLDILTNEQFSAELDRLFPNMSDFSATPPRAISKVVKKQSDTESAGLNCNQAALIAGPSSPKSTPGASVHDDSRLSTSRGRPCSLPRHGVRPRTGRPLKASTVSSSSTGRQFLNTKSLTTLLSSLVNSSRSGETSSQSSIKNLTKGQHARLASHLKRLQSTPRAAPLSSRRLSHSRNLGRNPSPGCARTSSHKKVEGDSEGGCGSCGLSGQLSRSPSVSANRPPLLKTPDGRIIVIRQRSSGGSSSSVGTASDNSRNKSDGSKLDPRQRAFGGIADEFPVVGETSNLQASSSASEKRGADSGIKRPRVFFSDDDSGESDEEAGKANLPSTLRVTGGEERKRKFGIVHPPVTSVIRSKDAKDEDSLSGTTPGSEGRSRETPLDSSASSTDTTSKSTVAMITSEEESDDQSASPVLKRPRVELLDDLKKNYAD